MGHLIDQTKNENGAFVSFQQPAWHGLGVVLTEELTADNILKEGGLDYNVEKLPNIHRIPTGDPENPYKEIVSEKSFFTYRTDTNNVLGQNMGKNYTVYQNIEQVALVDEMVQSGKVKIETAGAIDEGRKTFICLRMANDIVMSEDDVIKSYILLCNSHDMSVAITALPTEVRVVCNNTLQEALMGKGGYRMKHTINANDRVKEAFKILGMMEDNQKQTEDLYNMIKNTIITREQFFDYACNIFLTAEEVTEIQTTGKSVKDVLSTRKYNVLESVLNFASSGVGQEEALGSNKELNMYWAYNAITGYLTSKAYGTEDDRFESLILGDSADKGNNALLLAKRPELIRSLKKTGLAS